MSSPESLRARLSALLRDRSLTQGSFVLASGRRSSFYIDARRTTMSGEGLFLVGALGLAALRSRHWMPRAIGGLTLGADPVAYAIAAAAHREGVALDAFTVRKAPKDHGTSRRIEGCFQTGDAVIVVEDVVTTGGSALEAIQAVRAEGGQVLGVLAVVDREQGGRAAIEASGAPLEVLIRARELGIDGDGE